MYKAHKRLRVFSVLFAIAKEYVGIECITHSLGKLVTDKHGAQVFIQLLAVGYGGVVTVIFI